MTNMSERGLNWLTEVQTHASTSAEHYAAAKAMLEHYGPLPSEHTAAADELVTFKLAVRDRDGSYRAIDEEDRKYGGA